MQISQFNFCKIYYIYNITISFYLFFCIHSLSFSFTFSLNTFLKEEPKRIPNEQMLFLKGQCIFQERVAVSLIFFKKKSGSFFFFFFLEKEKRVVVVKIEEEVLRKNKFYLCCIVYKSNIGCLNVAFYRKNLFVENWFTYNCIWKIYSFKNRIKWGKNPICSKGKAWILVWKTGGRIIIIWNILRLRSKSSGIIYCFLTWPYIRRYIS